MRSWATLPEVLGGVAPFAPILDTVKTGEPGFDAALGTDLFSYLRDHPDHGAAFDAAMAERTAAFAPSVAEAGDFSRARTVVDVGGGNGMLLAQILRQHPHLDGVLFDSPAVTSRPNTLLTAPDLAGRCRIEPGDFFDRVPTGGDVYVMANIVHDWDDTRAATILHDCARAMNEDGRIRMIPDSPAEAVPALVSDISMLVLTGGRERTVTEYAALLDAAGLTLRSVRPVSFPYGVLEGTR
ncbi:methyltransferase [Kitasatospora sp. NPDC001540]|uniref:methyltransferase n=1 Tax=Kitasatospora sp. NPDC001540 TaxID=3364014 RepID=UPI0036AC4FC9